MKLKHAFRATHALFKMAIDEKRRGWWCGDALYHIQLFDRNPSSNRFAGKFGQLAEKIYF